MKNLGFYNGKIDTLENMQVPMLDRACYFGDGVYDASCARNQTIFALQDHLDRFYNSAKLLDINIPYTMDQLREILLDCVKKVDSNNLFVYWQVSRGSDIRNHIYPKDMKGNMWIMITEKHMPDRYKELNVTLQEDTRFLHNNIKTINLIPAVMYCTNASRNNYDEAILHRGNNRVTECSHSNVSIIKDNTFITAPCDQYILPGISRKHLLSACKALNIPYKEELYSVDTLLDADEIIVSSSSNLCRRVASIDGIKRGGKNKELFTKLQDYVYQEFSDYTDNHRID